MFPAHACDVLTPRQLTFIAERLRNRHAPRGGDDRIGTRSCSRGFCRCSVLVAAGGTLIDLAPPRASPIGAACATGPSRPGIAGFDARS